MIRDPVSEFQLSLSEYLKKCNVIKVCVFTKHDLQSTCGGDFSCFIKYADLKNPNTSNVIKDRDCENKSAYIILEKELNDLICESRREQWNLLISKYILKENRIYIHLDREHAFFVGIETVHKLGKCYGIGSGFKAKVMIPLQHCNINGDCNLTQLRVKLAWKILKSLSTIGNEGNKEMDENFTTLNLDFRPLSKNTVIVGPVMNRQTSAKECVFTENSYCRLRREDMEELGDHKENNKEMFQDLLHAVVSFDLLSTKLERPVILDFSEGPKASRDLRSRGAPFVLYNYARLNTILRQFEQKQKEGIYPPLPPVGELVKLLVEEEEWKLMFNFVLSWPEVVRNSFDEVHPKIHLVYSFLSTLALCFSIYYRRHRVLTEPLPQLLPLVFARIHLLNTIERIFLNAFNILDIKPLPFM